MAAHQTAHQKPLQQDWANREYVEVITGSIKKITDFLNSFDMSCRSRLAVLNQKLTELERRVEYIEARLLDGDAGVYVSTFFHCESLRSCLHQWQVGDVTFYRQLPEMFVSGMTSLEKH